MVGGALSSFLGAAVVVEERRKCVLRCDVACAAFVMCGVVTFTLFKEEVAGVAWLPMERRMRLKEAALVDMDWTSLAKRETLGISVCKKKDGKNGRRSLVVAGKSYPPPSTIKGKSELQLLAAHLPKRTVAGGSRRCRSG